jgi:hypothetical protein
MSEIKTADDVRDAWSAEALGIDRTGEQYPTALTFDDILLKPQHSTVLPYEVLTSTS